MASRTATSSRSRAPSGAPDEMEEDDKVDVDEAVNDEEAVRDEDEVKELIDESDSLMTLVNIIRHYI